MNSGAPEMYYSQHMSAGPAPQTQTVTSNALPQYQQPPLLHPASQGYSSSPYQYGGYPSGLSPQSAPPVSNSMGGQNVLPLPGVPNQPMGNAYPDMDTSGQIAPVGMKPRVTATLWEDEGSLCFQVEARGICVARREDNSMINGTKLLNVAGMTRGRRDGILKSEKIRHVVKIGPMHLKGVWIPFERALDFANKEKITEMLYPLFVHNIGALLYHPTNQSRTNQVMAAAERRKQEQNQQRAVNGTRPPGMPSMLPSIQQHQHHHHMSLPGPQPPMPAPNGHRPSLDRAHTFPTPPTSASSVMGTMGPSESYQQWPPQHGMNTAPNTNPMSIDTSLSNAARSMPATPATTPPGASLQGMQYAQGTQPYDAPRGYHGQTAQQSTYPTTTSSPQARSSYAHSAYMRGEMAPPTGRPGDEDAKQSNGLMHGQTADHGAQPNAEDEAEHEGEYTHDRAAYDQSSYNYGAQPAPLTGENAHLPPEMTGSPNHQAGSGRATPRTAAQPPSFYPQSAGYNTPPRSMQHTSSSVYNVMSNDRGQINGATSGDVYGSQAEMGGGLPSGYAPTNVLKRGRDDDAEDMARTVNGGVDLGKRRKTLDGPMPVPHAYETMSRPTSAVSHSRR